MNTLSSPETPLLTNGLITQPTLVDYFKDPFASGSLDILAHREDQLARVALMAGNIASAVHAAPDRAETSLGLALSMPEDIEADTIMDDLLGKIFGSPVTLHDEGPGFRAEMRAFVTRTEDGTAWTGRVLRSELPLVQRENGDIAVGQFVVYSLVGSVDGHVFTTRQTAMDEAQQLSLGSRAPRPIVPSRALRAAWRRS
jgi:hypothetical protein